MSDSDFVSGDPWDLIPSPANEGESAAEVPPPPPPAPVQEPEQPSEAAADPGVAEVDEAPSESASLDAEIAALTEDLEAAVGVEDQGAPDHPPEEADQAGAFLDDLPEIDVPDLTGELGADIDMPDFATDAGLPHVVPTDLDLPDLTADLDIPELAADVDVPDLTQDLTADLDVPDLVESFDAADATVDLDVGVDVEIPDLSDLTADLASADVGEGIEAGSDVDDATGDLAADLEVPDLGVPDFEAAGGDDALPDTDVSPTVETGLPTNDVESIDLDDTAAGQPVQEPGSSEGTIGRSRGPLSAMLASTGLFGSHDADDASSEGGDATDSEADQVGAEDTPTDAAAAAEGWAIEPDEVHSSDAADPPAVYRELETLDEEQPATYQPRVDEPLDDDLARVAALVADVEPVVEGGTPEEPDTSNPVVADLDWLDSGAEIGLPDLDEASPDRRGVESFPDFSVPEVRFENDEIEPIAEDESALPASEVGDAVADDPTIDVVASEHTASEDVGVGTDGSDSAGDEVVGAEVADAVVAADPFAVADPFDVASVADTAATPLDELVPDSESAEGVTFDSGDIASGSVDAEYAGLESLDTSSFDIESVDIESVDIESVDIESVDIESVDIESVDGSAFDIPSVGESVDEMVVGEEFDATTPAVGSFAVEPTALDSGDVEVVDTHVESTDIESDVPPIEASAAPSMAESDQEVAAQSAPAVAAPATAIDGGWGVEWEESQQGWVNGEWRTIVTTAPALASWSADVYLGVVAGDAVVASTEPHAIAEARNRAAAAMVAAASARGAHAVLSVSQTILGVGDAMVVSMAGTAVTLIANAPSDA